MEHCFTPSIKVFMKMDGMSSFNSNGFIVNDQTLIREQGSNIQDDNQRGGISIVIAFILRNACIPMFYQTLYVFDGDTKYGIRDAFYLII
jgi:hypothetical protein